MIPPLVNRYLEKRGHVAPLVPFEPEPRFHRAVVIPAMAEFHYLAATLNSLASNPESMLEDTLFLILINQPSDASPEIVENNLRTVEMLNNSKLPNLFYLNTVLEGGVGGARKLGMDIALTKLDWSVRPLLFCLDADTLTKPNYLQNIAQAMEKNPQWSGAVVNFNHQLPDDPKLRQAVIEYEFFMRYYVEGLRWAGSPYAFHSLGSATICWADEYVRCGGMRIRNGGEDFYFAQSLRKLGEIGFIDSTTIYPAGRVSSRVAFGTGPRLGKIIEGQALGFYDFGIFIELKQLFDLVANTSPTELVEALPSVLHNQTIDFMTSQKFSESWPKILRNTPANDVALRAAFHTWLDGFRTLKLVHHLERTVSAFSRTSFEDAQESVRQYRLDLKFSRD